MSEQNQPYDWRAHDIEAETWRQKRRRERQLRRAKGFAALAHSTQPAPDPVEMATQLVDLRIATGGAGYLGAVNPRRDGAASIWRFRLD